MDGAGRMRSIGEAAARAARHRKFTWCRRDNGFCDLPVWRLVAARLSLPLYQVVAFANRLEELANAAANVGEVRGCVVRFQAEEFGMALGMNAEDAARIFAELEAPEIGWIAYDHVANFYDRNPDRIDEGAADRKRRQRLRERIIEQLGKLAREGKIDQVARRSVEEALNGTVEELRDLQTRLARIEIAPHLSTVTGVTRDSAGGPNNLSPGPGVTRDVTKSHCDIVTVTPEQSKIVVSDAVDKIGDAARVDPASWPKVEVVGATSYQQRPPVAAAEHWLKTEGLQLVRDRLRILPGQAETTLARWRRDLDDDAVALGEIVVAVAAAADPQRPSIFHIMISDRIKRAKQEAKGRELPLMTPLAGLKGSGAA